MSKTDAVKVLPTLFSNSSNSVDVELVKEILVLRPKSSKLVRELLEDISSMKLSPTENAVEVFSRKIPEIQFRESWYLQKPGGKRSSLPPLFSLVDDYVSQRHQWLGLNSKALSTFFEKRKKKGMKGNLLFPILSRLEVLISALQRTMQISLRDTALFSWSLLEASSWFSKEYPGESSLTRFEREFFKSIESPEFDELRALLQPHAWPHEKCISSDEENTSDFSGPKDLGSKGLLKDNQLEPPNVQSVYFEKITEANKLANKLVELTSRIGARLTSISSFESYSEADLDLVESARQIQGAASKVGSARTQIELELERKIDEALAPLGLEVSESFSDARIREGSWEEFIKARVELFCRLNNVLSDKIFEVFSAESIDDQPKASASYDDAEMLVSQIRDELHRKQNGLRAYEKIERTTLEKKLDFLWNPFSDSDITAGEWLAFGRYLIDTNTYGVRLACSAKLSPEALIADIGTALAHKHKNEPLSAFLRQNLDFLTYLSLTQLETLGIKSPGLQAVVAIAELERYLFSENKEAAFVVFSLAPLRNYMVPDNEDVFAAFFAEIYKLGSSIGHAQLDIKILKRVAQQVRNEKHYARDEMLSYLQKSLQGILRYYPKSGGKSAYGILWKYSYEAILQNASEQAINGIDENLIFELESIKNKLNVEEHLAQIKSKAESEGNSIRGSHYDKAIRGHLNLKINEIEQWLEKYYEVFSEAAEHEQYKYLVAKVSDIYSSQDSKAKMLAVWLDGISAAEMKPRTVPPQYSLAINQSSSDEIPDGRWGSMGPRRILATVAGVSPSYNDYFSDAFVQEFGGNSAEELAIEFAANKAYEAYSLLAEVCSEEIPIWLDRKIDGELEALDTTLQNRMDELRAKSSSFGAQDDEYICSYFGSIEEKIKKGGWTKAEAELNDLENYLANLESARQKSAEKKKLTLQIHALGGACSETSSLEDMQALYISLLRDTAPRRRHIAPLRSLLEVIDEPVLVAAISQSIETAEEIRLLPSAEVSEYLELAISTAVNPLAAEMRRLKTLNAVHASNVQALVLTLVSNLTADSLAHGDESPIIRLLAETSDLWETIAINGRSSVDALFQAFRDSGLAVRPSTTFEVSAHGDGTTVWSAPSGDLGDSNGEQGLLDAAYGRAIRKIVKASAPGVQRSYTQPGSIPELIEAADWDGALLIARKKLCDVAESSRPPTSELADYLAFSYFSARPLSLDDHAILVSLLPNVSQGLALGVVSPARGQKGSKHEKIVLSFMGRVASSMKDESVRSNSVEGKSVQDAISIIADNSESLAQYKELLQIAFSSSQTEQPFAIKIVWDALSGDSRQAELRADLMKIMWLAELRSTLAWCFRFPPVEMEARRSIGLAHVAISSIHKKSSSSIQIFADALKVNTSKPFQLFVSILNKRTAGNLEEPIELRLVGPVERIDRSGQLRAVLSITPTQSSWTDSLTLVLPANSPISFMETGGSILLQGPFFEATSQALYIKSSQQQATHFTLEVQCKTTSIAGDYFEYVTPLVFEIAGSSAFNGLSVEQIDSAYNGFPEYHMRGENYVARRADERKIEAALFGGKVVRSLWISSPRRSGKTTMLFRIIDAYSHKVRQDNVVVYVTLDRGFSQDSEFNDWLWKRVSTISSNVELRACYENFSEIEKHLPFEADSGTFISAFADKLKEKNNVNRVIFLFDEVDKLASMYFEGGARREAALSILWQLRNALNERRDLGIVFAGSSAARQIFVSAPEGAFYNGITGLELSPFSVDTAETEQATRLIVEPVSLKNRYVMPKNTLRQITLICSGIPYYMKLLAGATLAIAKQSYILESDVRQGLSALLSKVTGIPKLDEMSGDPGSDELRTIALEQGEDKIVVLAVLYSFAEMHSVISGRSFRRGRLSSDDSPLATRYLLPKPVIDKGIDLAITLGLLKRTGDEGPDLTFAIPMLGESIRNSIGSYWSNIDHELEKLSEKYRAKEGVIDV